MSDIQNPADLLFSLEDIRRKTLTLQRNDMLLRAGEVEKHLYFIVSGAIHAFYVSESEEHTIRFGYKGSLITSIPSFYDQRPSEIYLQAIRKTEIVAFDREDFVRVMNGDPTLRSFYIASLEQLAGQQMEREFDLLTSSPSERLRRVMERSPSLFQEIPAKYIASYLRMSPETLSRIMNS